MQLRKYLINASLSMTFFSELISCTLATDLQPEASEPIAPTVRPVARVKGEGPLIVFEDVPGNNLLATLNLLVGEVAPTFIFKKQAGEEYLASLTNSLAEHKKLKKDQREILFPEMTKENLVTYLYWISRMKIWEKEKFNINQRCLPHDMQHLLETYKTDENHKKKVDDYIEIRKRYLNLKRTVNHVKAKIEKAGNAFSFCNDLPLLANKLLNMINENPSYVVLTDYSPFVKTLFGNNNLFLENMSKFLIGTKFIKSYCTCYEEEQKDFKLLNKDELFHENISDKYKTMLMERREALMESFFKVLKAFQNERGRQRDPFLVQFPVVDPTISDQG